MKKIITTTVLPIASGIALTLLTINISLAQTPPPPNGTGGTPVGNNTPVGGGAPIAGGLGILLILGATYGGKKVYDIQKRKLED